jgi:hypothetical protein
MTSRKLHSIFSKTPVVALLFCAATLFAQTRAYITFDAPDAGVGTNQGTFPICMNNKGVIAGTYTDSALHSHGFVRDPAGIITEFTPPGVTSTQVVGINNRGEIVGLGATLTEISGFLRTASGRLVYVSFPGSVATEPSAINDSGEITGVYVDKAQLFHGFIRHSSGAYTTFDEPDARLGKTFAGPINNSGEIAGYYSDHSTAELRVFLRDQFGNFTTFEVPGATHDVFAVGINLSGEITGWGRADGFAPFSGYLRDTSGSITPIVVSGLNTIPVAINDSGLIVGQWGNDRVSTGGFARDTSGDITTFSDPLGKHGTFPAALNNVGRITGYYYDMNDVAHGFVR